MKKVILGFVVVMMMLATATTYVNAASLGTNKKEYTIGENVTVTIDMKPTRSVGIKLSYDADALEFKNVTSDTGKYQITGNIVGKGRLVVSGFDTTGDTTGKSTIGKITIIFKAKKETNEARFEVTDFEGTSGDTLEEINKNIKIVKKSETPVKPEKPEEPEEPKKDSEIGKKPTKKPAESGEKPTRLPQTGVPYISIAFAGIVVIAGIATTVKIKNK